MVDDEVRALLRERGCPDEVVEAGIHGLVAEWERVAGEVAGGYSLGLDDYVNDLDTRQLLEDALPRVPADDRAELVARVRVADERFRASAVPAAKCLWGPAVAEAEGWTRERQWWYFNVPRRAGTLLREDLVDL